MGVFAHPLPFNVIPHIDKFLDDQYTKEERKVTWETRKIMGLPDLPVSCTCVRIPTLRAHAEAITIETEKPVDIAKARACLESATGVELVDDPANQSYPMPINATAKYDVEVGRLRKNTSSATTASTSSSAGTSCCAARRSTPCSSPRPSADAAAQGTTNPRRGSSAHNIFSPRSYHQPSYKLFSTSWKATNGEFCRRLSKMNSVRTPSEWQSSARATE